MTKTIRLFLLVESVGFVPAALVHRGVFVAGYDDPVASIAEATIAVALLLGLALTRARPARTAVIGLVAQGFALTGTLIGTYFNVVVRLGTVPDIAFHVVMVSVLAWGLFVAARASGPRGDSSRTAWATVIRVLIRATFLLQLAVGIGIWTGTLRVSVPFHIFNGVLFVLLLETQAVLAARAGVSWRLVILSSVWGVFVAAFGLTQTAILAGELHWIVQVAHAAAGFVAIGLAERLARSAHALAGSARLTPTMANRLI